MSFMSAHCPECSGPIQCYLLQTQVLAEILQQGARIDDPDAAARQEFVRCVGMLQSVRYCTLLTFGGCAPAALCLLWRGAHWPGVHTYRAHD